MKKNLLFTILALFTTNILFAQIPTGYYDNADGQSGYTLKSTLHDIIDDHTDMGYGELWTLYETSDVRADGKVWEMYSDCDFIFGTDQDGGSGGTTECDVYNREHSWPKSWFDDGSPMINDPFHVVPSDKKVNSERGNNAFGEVGTANYTSNNGSKSGNNILPGFSGTVFEPIDEYKGDFARGYFYMATRYEDVISNWENNNQGGDAMLDGSNDQVFENWALEMLIRWHKLDPVSDKEIVRNNAIHDYQGNRNPFIDHPEYVSCIWENNCSSEPPPMITVVESITNFGAVENDMFSTSQNFTIEATGLAENILITASTNFEVSLDDNSFDQIVTVPQTDGTAAITTIYLRFSPQTGINQSIAGELSISTANYNTTKITLSGIETGNVALPSDLFFSEYIEGSKQNKAIEIYNATGASVDLSNYQVRQSHNGIGFGNDPVADVYDITLSGTLAEGDVYVIYNGEADKSEMISEGDLALSYANSGEGVRLASFNGNDAIGLFKNDVLIDLIGDPDDGSIEGWEVAGVATATLDHVLVRKATISTGNPNALLSFGTTIENSEWIVIDSSMVSGIGSHTVTNVATPTISLVSSITNFGAVEFGNSSVAQTYTVSGSDLSGAITITASENFEIALVDNDENYGQMLSLDQSDGLVTSTTVFVRFTPTDNSNTEINGTITHMSEGATSQTLSISGSETTDPVIPTIAFSGNAAFIEPSDEFNIKVTSSQIVSESLTVEISIADVKNIVYGENGFVTDPVANNNIINATIPAGASDAQVNIKFGETVNAPVTKKIAFIIEASDHILVGANDTFIITVNPGEEAPVVTDVDIDQESGQLIYPNPASEYVLIKNVKQISQIKVYNQIGEKVFEDNATDKIDVKSWNEGIYYMQIFEKNSTTAHKLIVSH